MLDYLHFFFVFVAEGATAGVVIMALMRGAAAIAESVEDRLSSRGKY